ncbi:hypothetical protein MKW94_003335, partial [Papaver nudicaule]|nr:hypothetical protein [Papaver nudicaule]
MSIRDLGSESDKQLHQDMFSRLIESQEALFKRLIESQQVMLKSQEAMFHRLEDKLTEALLKS